MAKKLALIAAAATVQFASAFQSPALRIQSSSPSSSSFSSSNRRHAFIVDDDEGDPLASVDNFSKSIGETALKKVEQLGNIVASQNDDDDDNINDSRTRVPTNAGVPGEGSAVFEGNSSLKQITGTIEERKANQVWVALARLEKDSKCIS